MFLRKPRIQLLPVTMSAVRMGERVLQIGLDDPAFSPDQTCLFCHGNELTR